MKTSFFIDGYNLYYSIRNSFPNEPQYKWLNIHTLCSSFLGNNDTLGNIYFFTAYFKDDSKRKNKLKNYLAVLEDMNIIPVFGKFKKRPVQCWVRNCSKKKSDRVFQKFEEKESDVNIAIYLLEKAFTNSYDKAIIISGDSDLVPAVKAIKRNFKDKRIGVALPPHQKGNDIGHQCNFKIKITKNDIKTNCLPNIVTLKNGRKITSPYIQHQTDFKSLLKSK